MKERRRRMGEERVSTRSYAGSTQALAVERAAESLLRARVGEIDRKKWEIGKRKDMQAVCRLLQPSCVIE